MIRFLWHLFGRPAHAQGVTNPLPGVDSLEKFVTNVIVGGFFPALGIAAFVVALWGALQWITSGGSKERVKLGKDTFVWVFLGLLLAFGGYVLLRFIIETFTNMTLIQK